MDLSFDSKCVARVSTFHYRFAQRIYNGYFPRNNSAPSRNDRSSSRRGGGNEEVDDDVRSSFDKLRESTAVYRFMVAPLDPEARSTSLISVTVAIGRHDTVMSHKRKIIFVVPLTPL